MPSISLIIAGAGHSRRFPGPVGKTYVQIAAKPVFLWALDRFADFAEITQRLLLVAANDLSMVQNRWAAELGQRQVQLVAGGAERFDSVKAALALVDPSADLVAVHDAARPAICPQVIARVFEAAAQTGAALVARQVHETIKKAEPIGLLSHVQDRSAYWLAQTPQVFARELLIRAYADWPAKNEYPTDDAQVVESAGQKAAVVPVGPENIKITTADDLKLVESILLER